ncbi:unnamed protein product [Moneuplotes crassus]|uniref:Uncharacterized protein n=1 Tax=Euplotes crassus TaxID=5936 RepID=A0AAD1UU93_EUPCR|nr:unnamed protein product [Moneuplotes crassus]
MDSIPKVVEEENTEIITLEKSILEETKEQDINRCQSILSKIYPEKEEIKPLDPDSEEVPENSELMIDLRNAKLSKSLKNLKLFDINRIVFNYVNSKNKHFLNFLESSFPNKTNVLHFYSWNKMDLNRSNYLNSLLRLSSKVVQTVTIQYFCIGLPQLKRLVAAYKHTRGLVFLRCKLSIPSVPDFSKALTNCQIQKIGFEGSGNYYFSEWEDSPDQFKNLIQGLASSPDLRLSLKEVDIYCCRVTKNKAKRVFEENQLGDVEIIVGR